MSESAYLGKHIGDAGCETLGVVFVNPHLFRNPVRHRKTDAGNIGCQRIGILPDLLRRLIAVFLVDL